jgi:outer membrane beta-barrel protein
MKTRRILLTSLATLTVLTALAADAPTASAQEVQITGPLAGAPACRHCRIYRDKRFSISPLVGFSLRDEFSRTIFFGASAEFHITDWLGIGGFFAYGAIHIDTGLTDQVVDRGVTTERNRLSLPSRGGFDNQIGEITFVAAPQVLFIPLRGKLSLFQKVFIDTDFYIHLGVAITGVEERANVTDTNVCSGASVTPACLDSQVARSSRIAINATFGAGLRLYFNDWIGLTLEWRGLPFRWNTSGTDEGGDPRGNFPDDVINADDRIRHFNQMVSVGVSIYLPTSVRISE